MSQFPISEDRHYEAQLLLPWYATGQIDRADRAVVEAHLAECESCRAELAVEHSLRRELESAAESGPGWAALAGRLRSPSAPPAAPPRRRPWASLVGAARRPTVLRWTVAAQFVLLVALGALILAPQPRSADYRTLGEAPTSRGANAIAIFRPETRESELRALLDANQARLVGGPTAAGAYLLDVPGGETGEPLAKLRRDPHVTMAESIDPAPAE